MPCVVFEIAERTGLVTPENFQMQKMNVCMEEPTDPDAIRQYCEVRLQDGQSRAEDDGSRYSDHVEKLVQALSLIEGEPYCMPLYVSVARKYLDLHYPDLSAGAAYKALLLTDAISDEDDEYHERALEAISVFVSVASFQEPSENVVDGSTRSCEGNEDISYYTEATAHFRLLIYRILVQSLHLCGCYRTAFSYCLQGKKQYPDDLELSQMEVLIQDTVHKTLPSRTGESQMGEHSNPNSWPDHGFVRRELYPWNQHEPDRLADLPVINEMMQRVAPNLEVLAVDLPVLTDDSEGPSSVKQLGVFAKNDIAPGEVLLTETSVLTANNKLQDALCDACSADLPALDSPGANEIMCCPNCELVFCSDECYNTAIESYHPVLCDMDVDAIARDVPPAQAADSLYSLLLLRALAMAETQQCHPLELKEVKYIWGDFHSTPVKEDWSQDGDPRPSQIRKDLPFSFEHNIRLPFHMLEKMDIDIFADPQYDVWVFNTLYAKFRGTASARLSGLGGRAVRGPEVSAVHPMWCLANHSCDPNVSWEWGGSIKFWARERKVGWERNGRTVRRSEAGIKKGEEVLNHYCDIDLPVGERREWARGALGGDCRCSRCVWEAQEAQSTG